MEDKKKLKIAIIVVAILLLLSCLVLAGVLLYKHFAADGPATVVIPDNIITQDPAPGATTKPTDSTEPTAATDPTKATEPKVKEVATAIYIHNRNPGDNEPFYVDNMFPGDVEKQNFCIHVTYKDAVTLKFKADIYPGYEKLAEVLKCKVTLLGSSDQVLYDGLMRDMPASIDVNLPYYADPTGITVARYYEVTAYLDTSVGNEYQNKELKANFTWWVEETPKLMPPTGDNTQLVLLCTVCGVSALGLILLLTLKKKKGGRYAK